VFLGSVVADPAGASPPADCGGYSLSHKPFINPAIVEDLETWISDTGEQIVAINIPGSIDTNRYFQPFQATPPELDEGYPYIH